MSVVWPIIVVVWYYYSCLSYRYDFCNLRHMEFVTRDGEKHTRIEFNLRGQFRTATVHAETFIVSDLIFLSSYQKSRSIN